jgi:hypothetical protein
VKDRLAHARGESEAPAPEADAAEVAEADA